jgi:hypothetical protein
MDPPHCGEVYFASYLERITEKQCSGSALVSMRIRIQLFTSVRIRIRIPGANPLRIRILLGLFRHKKLNFYMKNMPKVDIVIGHEIYLRTGSIQKHFWKAWKSGFLLILVNFLAAGYGSGSAFPRRIQIRILVSQINADPDPQHLRKVYAVACSQNNYALTVLNQCC